jgi:hypothetical protein
MRRSERNQDKETDMASDLMQSSANENGSDKDTLYMLGGVAMLVFGAGLILSNPNVRRYMSQFGVGNLATTVIPDVERYFKLRAM